MRTVLPALLLLLTACASWETPPDPGYRWERKSFDAESDTWTQVPIQPGEPGYVAPATTTAPAPAWTPAPPPSGSPPPAPGRPGVPPPPPPPAWPP